MSVRKETLQRLLKPHIGSLSVAGVAVLLEQAATLAEPWPLKVVVDDVLTSKSTRTWFGSQIVAAAGGDRYLILKWAAVSVVIIAFLGAICTYWEKLLATKVAQRVILDLRRLVYAHVQRLSLGYHAR